MAQFFQLSTQILELSVEFMDLVLHPAQRLSNPGHGRLPCPLVFEVFSTSAGLLVDLFGDFMQAGCMEVFNGCLEVV